MDKERYRVDYHAVETIYLRPGSAISGPDFARLWSGMGVFEECRGAAGGFWHAGTNPGKQRPIGLGSLEFVNPLLDLGPQPIFGGGTYAKTRLARDSTRDCDFYYAHADASRWLGDETLPYLHFAVSGQWFERTGAELVVEKMREHLEVADGYEPAYGLIDISDPEDSYAGLNYGDIFFGNSRLHSWVEQANWVHGASKRRDRVRSIYWGNYFGPAILKRLGGRKKFLAGYRQQAGIRGTIDARIWEFPNGVFVSLCLDPLGCKPGPPVYGPAVSNLLYLVKELGSCGALCAWGG